MRRTLAFTLVATLAACSVDMMTATPDGGPPDVGGDAFATDASRNDAASNDAAVAPDTGVGCPVDADNDHHVAASCGGDDCDDDDANRFPTNPEVCDSSSHDEDCDATTFGSRDVDGDGQIDAMCCNVDAAGTHVCGNDCDDSRASVYPGLVEVCDSLDNDCDTAVDEGVLVTVYRDLDGDGYGSGAPLMMCAGTTGFAPLPGDCDDTAANVHPGAPELCDRIDEDCSSGGGIDTSEDADHDGYAPVGSTCAGGYPSTDCNDADVSVQPGAPELCDGRDDDCSSGGGTEPAEDVDGDMHAPLSAACAGGPFPRDDCRDDDASAHPGATELCDRIDSNCSAGGGVETSEDADADGHTAPAAACTGGPLPKDDCDDTNAAVFPGAAPSVPTAPLAPDNGAYTGSMRAPAASGVLRPSFRWLATAPVCGVTPTYEIVVDDSCTTPGFASCAFASPEAHGTAIATTSYRPTTDLPVSATAPVGRRYYWRVRACVGALCGPWGAVRYLDVGRVPDDFNGDGYSDVVVGEPNVFTAQGQVIIYNGTPTGVPVFLDRRLDPPTPQNYSYFGGALAGGADLNGDGYGDLAVGAYQQAAPAYNEGNVFVYLGGPSGLPFAPSVLLDSPTNQAGALFGVSVASAGDTNADGYDDLVVGAFATTAITSMEGAAYVYLGGATGVPTTPNVSLTNPTHETMGQFGVSVSSAGDLDEDGYADIVVGAPQAGGATPNEGLAFVFRGSPSGVPLAPSVSLHDPGDQAGSSFGSSTASVGDVNGDGYDDLAVGAGTQTAGATSEGNVFVFLGGPGGIGTAPNTTIDSPGNVRLGFFGQAIAATDVNADGYSDLLAGQPNDAGPTSTSGNAYVFLGSAAGLATSPSTTLDDPGLQRNSGFGASLAVAGDVNGDGHLDVVVGARNQNTGAAGEGNAFVFHSGASGLSTTPAASIDSPGNDIGGSFGQTVARSDAPARREPAGAPEEVAGASVAIAGRRG